MMDRLPYYSDEYRPKKEDCEKPPDGCQRIYLMDSELWEGMKFKGRGVDNVKTISRILPGSFEDVGSIVVETECGDRWSLSTLVQFAWRVLD